MSFGGGSSDFPAEPKRPLGLPEDRTPSMEADQPWVWFCGTRPIGLFFLSERFNVRIDPVYQETKKDAVEVGKNVYVDQVAGLALGEVHAVQQIKIDEEVVWAGPLYNSGNEYDDITVEGRGTVRFYWGSETQTIDADLADEGHPAYRGKSYVIFLDFFCGYQQEQLPAVVFILSRWPTFSWCAESNIEGDCNGAAVLGDLLTNDRVGLGWPESRLNTTALALLADQFADDCFGISPIVDSNETLQSILTLINQHLGGFPLPAADGLFDYRLIREWPAADPVVTIDESHLLEEPEEEPEAADETTTEVILTYLNRDNGMKADYVTWSDPGNYAARAENRSQQIDCKFFTRPAAAQIAAGWIGPLKAMQDTQGTLRVRLDAIDGLELGHLFRHSYGATELCGLPVRCVEISIPDPAKPEAVVGYRLDRGHLANQQFVPSDILGALRASYDPQPIEHQRVIELPSGQPLAQTDQRLVVLASRPTTTTTGIRAWLQKPGGSYTPAASGTSARHGVLLEDYSANTLLIDDGVGFLIQLDGADLTLPSIDVADALANEWLAFIGDEILSIFGATLIAPGQYRVQAVRARYDTIRETHPTDDDVFIVPLISLLTLGIYDGRNLAAIKVQPVAIGGPLDLAEIDAENLSLTRRNLKPLRPVNLELNATKVGASYSTGGDVDVTWETVPEYKSSFWTPQTQLLPAGRVMVFDSTGALAAVHSASEGAASCFLSNAQIIADLGSEVDFTVRVYQVRNGYVSTHYAERSITFV